MAANHGSLRSSVCVKILNLSRALVFPSLFRHPTSHGARLNRKAPGFMTRVLCSLAAARGGKKEER